MNITPTKTGLSASRAIISSANKLMVCVMLFTILQGVSAQELLLSEDFSSPAWENELYRLNPCNDSNGNPINSHATNPAAYTTPPTGGGSAFQNLNSTDLYFGKYKLNGSIESLVVLPCPLGPEFDHFNVAPIEIPFADPTIFSENGKFYLTGTRPGSPAGFVMLESTDLKAWTLSTTNDSGMILTKGDGVYGESGFWAPQIFRENSTYYMTYTASEHVTIATSNTVNGKYTQNTRTTRLFTAQL